MRVVSCRADEIASARRGARRLDRMFYRMLCIPDSRSSGWSGAGHGLVSQMDWLDRSARWEADAV